MQMRSSRKHDHTQLAESGRISGEQLSRVKQLLKKEKMSCQIAIRDVGSYEHGCDAVITHCEHGTIGSQPDMRMGRAVKLRFFWMLVMVATHVTGSYWQFACFVVTVAPPPPKKRVISSHHITQKLSPTSHASIKNNQLRSVFVLCSE